VKFIRPVERPYRKMEPRKKVSLTESLLGYGKTSEVDGFIGNIT